MCMSVAGYTLLGAVCLGLKCKILDLNLCCEWQTGHCRVSDYCMKTCLGSHIFCCFKGVIHVWTVITDMYIMSYYILCPSGVEWKCSHYFSHLLKDKDAYFSYSVFDWNILMTWNILLWMKVSWKKHMFEDMDQVVKLWTRLTTA